MGDTAQDDAVAAADDMAERIAAMPADDRQALMQAMDDLKFAGLPQSYAEDQRYQPAVASAQLPVAMERTRPNLTANGHPLVPPREELAMLGQMAVTLCAAKTVPAALRDAPNDVFLILLAARDLGVDLSTAIREFHVVEGKVTISPKVKLAMVRRQGLGRVWPDPGNSDQEATWYAVRYDYGEDQVFAFTFTMDDAKRAKLIKDKSAWTTYPQRMLSWRALGYLLDDVFSEVGAGLYAPDELGAVVDEDGNPVLDVTEVDPVRGTRPPRRRGRNRAAEDAAAAEQQVELLADADRDELQATIDRIREVPAAKDALVRAWGGADDEVREACKDCTAERGCDLHRALWPLKQLPAVDKDVAAARITGVVLQLAAGEHLQPGEPVPPWVPEYLAAAGVPAVAAPGAQDADPDAEQSQAPADPPAAADGAHSAEVQQSEGDGAAAADAELAGRDEDTHMLAVIDAVKGMRLDDVRQHLTDADLPSTGNSDTVRARLAQHLLAIGWTPAQPTLES